MTLTIFPAIDLRDGQVVRLQLGDPQRQTVFATDPLATAERWIAAGAEWLHVVNLDGAFDEAGRANWQVLPEICACGTKIQFGGGIRSLEDIEKAFRAGVKRVVLGTIAVEKPELVAQAVDRYGSQGVAVGIDARDGRVRTRGWQSGTSVTPTELAGQMAERGIEIVIYTDISRDGILSGVNVESTAALARATNLSVIASGGVAGLDDVRRTVAAAHDGISGLIIGQALYTERIELSEVLAVAGHSFAAGQGD